MTLEQRVKLMLFERDCSQFEALAVRDAKIEELQAKVAELEKPKPDEAA